MELGHGSGGRDQAGRALLAGTFEIPDVLGARKV